MKRDKIKNTDIIKALTASSGFIGAAAQKLKISRMTLYSWIKADDELTEAIDSINESLIDFTESKLMKLINEDNPAAIFFHLKCKAKHRGYIERTEVTGADGKDLTIKLVSYKDDDCR